LLALWRRFITLRRAAGRFHVILANLFTPEIFFMSQTEKRPSCIVIGAGSARGIGGACARRFAKGGFHVFVAGHTEHKISELAQTLRSEGGHVEPVVTDVTRKADIARLFDYAMSGSQGHAPPELVIYNAGNNKPIPLLDLDADAFEHYWRVGCYGGFLAGQEAVRRLLPLGRGSIIFTGASGSLRGREQFAHFAVAKAGLRMLAQSMAREFGPQGLHVAHVLIDGGVDGDRLRSVLPDLADRLGEDGMLSVEGIADAYWYLHHQPRSTWTQELDLRPYRESF
jgi:NAD(P)-dependent dehydrogenase (short-subunit alcohol dehydrogenase family)